MEHYVCTGGCGAVSDQPGVCEDQSCPMNGHEFVPCNCEDGLHAEVLQKAHAPVGAGQSDSDDQM